jgi:uncharacterized membrane protein YccF (DUF307 family)
MSKTIGHVSTEAAKMLVSVAIPMARANVELIPGPGVRPGKEIIPIDSIRCKLFKPPVRAAA